MTNTTWPGIAASRYFTEREKATIQAVASSRGISGPLTESVLSELRDGLDKLRMQGTADMDEQSIDKLQDIMMSASKFSSYLAQHFEKSFDKVLAFYVGGLESAKDELVRKIRNQQFAYPDSNMEHEVKDASKLASFWLKDFRRILKGQTTDKYAKCLLAESMQASADVITMLGSFRPDRLIEGKDPWSFLDRSRDAIAKIEPFSTIMSVAELGGSVGNSTMNKFADLSARIGAEKCCKLVGVGSIAGKLSELRGTKPDASAIIKADPMMRFMPAGKALIESFELIAFIVTALEVLTEIKKPK
jgi:hypothetical protein